jgi:hypothetical protein
MAKNAKYGFCHLIDLAFLELVTVTKHGRSCRNGADRKVEAVESRRLT